MDRFLEVEPGRRLFDPEAHLIVQFDQRGCGRSTPHAGGPATDLATNRFAPLGPEPA